MTSIALLSCPILVLVLFAKLTPTRALIWSVLICFLFLPQKTGFDFKGLPELDRVSILAIALAIGAYLNRNLDKARARQAAIETPPVVEQNRFFGWVVLGLIGLLFVSPTLSVLNNPEQLSFGPLRLPGTRMWDAVSFLATNGWLVIFYLLGRRYLATPEAHTLLLSAVVVMGLVYSVLVLFEIRMSPQLHNWIYGYYQHSFVQHIRGGGFRPMVFLKHGLWVGFFLFSVVMAALALAGRKQNDDKGSMDGSPASDTRMKYLMIAGFMFVVLFLSKNLAATALVVLLGPIILLMSPKWQLRAASVIAILFLLYPAMRHADLVPVERITDLAAKISEPRAQSLQFRLDNEEQLLARAMEKPWTGWGGWGRNLIYNEDGEKLTIIDGVWIVVLGTRGWLGYVAFFGLLVLPILMLGRTGRRKPITPQTAGLAMIMAGNFIYMVPNSALSPIGWIMAGALAGFVQYDPVRRSTPENDVSDIPERSRGSTRRPRYTRFGDNVPSGASARRGTASASSRSSRQIRSTSTP